MRAWMVRAGRRGEREARALDDGAVFVGWDEVGDLSEVDSREELRTLLGAIYPELSPQVIANWTGQLWRFREEIVHGDLVVMPVSGSGRRQVAVGTVTGPYRYAASAEPGCRHRRAVEWQRKDIDRDMVDPDLRDSMGSLLTVFELSRNQAAQRIHVLAEQGRDPGPDDLTGNRASISSPQRLEETVEAAINEGQTVSMTVRELLGIWGHSRRWASVVEEIRSELEQRGLSTKPSFVDGNINSRIDIVPVGTEPASGVPVPTKSELPDEPAAQDRPVALLVKQLPSATADLVFVGPGDPLSVATTLMAMNNYSQLPVVNGEGQLTGAVSWESVGMAHLAAPEPSLERATIQPRDVDGDDDLLEWIPEIFRRGFVFVRDKDRRLCGIVTSADLTIQLGSQVRPFVLIGEIERRLRRILDRLLVAGTVSIEQVRGQLRSHRQKQVQDPHDLTLGEYPYVFEHNHIWSALGWSLAREQFCARLRKAAEFRNNLAHLNPDVDPESENELLPLQGLLSTLRSLDE
jgi:restriction system protein